MHRIIGTTVFLAMLPGCTPGMLDYTEQIGDTEYEAVRTDSRSLQIFPRESCGPRCPSISRNIISFHSNRTAIAVRRQIVLDFRCDGKMLTSQYLDQYQQYVIVLKSNELVGPMSVGEYQAFVAQHPELLQGINLLDKEDMHDGSGTPLNSIDHCQNAKPA